MAALGLYCWMWAFSSCNERGLLSSCLARASHWRAFHYGGFSCCRAWAPGCARFNSCDMQALELQLGSCGSRAY